MLMDFKNIGINNSNFYAPLLNTSLWYDQINYYIIGF